MNDPTPPSDDEAQIRRLLLSPNEGERRAGLVWLAEKYCDEVCGYVRYWSNACRIAFAAQDIPDVWQDVLTCVWKNVNASGAGLDSNGSLPAYLKRIAHNRAVDKLRKRAAIASPELPEPVFVDDRGLDELLEAISACYAGLSGKLQMVLQVDVKLLIRESEWVSNGELTVEVNETFGLALDEEAVKSRRYRAREQLRACLRKRGYQW